MRLSPIFAAAAVGLIAGAGGRWVSDGSGYLTEGKRREEAVQTTHRIESNAPASAESLFVAQGFERWERLVIWLNTASAREVAAAAKAWRRSGGKDEDPLTGEILYLKWVALDPLAAIIPEPSEFAWQAWAHVDADAALAKALELNDKVNAGLVLQTLAKFDPARAKELLAQHPDLSSRGTRAALATGLSKTDPRAAAELAAQYCFTATPRAVASWAERDPYAALTWAKGLRVPERRIKVLEEIIEQWETSDPERIGAAIQNFAPSESRNRFTIEHAARLALKDADEALKWARSVASAEIRQACIAEVARMVTLTDTAKAAEILRSIDLNTPVESFWEADKFAHKSAMQELGAKDPLRALDLVDSLPSARASEARSAAFEGWIKNDASAATRWLESQPPERQDAGCIRRVVHHLSCGAGENLPLAFQWAAKLTDDDRENAQLVVSLFNEWREADPNAAEKALEMPSLSDAMRAHIRESAKPEEEDAE
ncbi:MAG TPA: hypothetical protein VG796_21795 [Verrucomicrobiales bacterium]|nr:hypothetical protein [Verrucomicrobiales bacterium]